jgi:hypothetical protein
MLAMLDVVGVDIEAVKASLPLDMGVFDVEKRSLSRLYCFPRRWWKKSGRGEVEGGLR